MLLKVDFESEVPIYLQIKIQIIEGIATGKLKKGESLPSVRQFAADLGINLHTVNKAYNYLKQDGFIIVHRQKGVVVNPGNGPTVTEEYTKKFEEDLRPIISEAYCRGMKVEEFIKVCSSLYSELADSIQGG